ncbi:MAG: FtsX-like permease family protein [Roseiflexaceae bacterium]
MRSHWHAARLILTAVWRRTRTNSAPTIALLVALVLPLMLGLTVPSYADAVGIRILNQELAAQSRTTQRPALALLYRYVRANKAVAWRTILSADALVSQNAAGFLQFPIARITRHIRTTPLNVMLVAGNDNGIPMDNAAIGTLVGIDEYMKYVSGRAPTATSNRTEIAVSQRLANRYGLNIDDVLVVSSSNGQRTLTGSIVGIWTPLQRDSQEWLYDPDALESLLLVAPQTLADVVSVTFPDSAAQAAWYIQPAPFMLAPSDVWIIEQRIRTFSQELAKVPAKLDRSPLERFTNTQDTIRTLTLRTSAVAAPIALLALFFVMQLANITYQRRQDEYILLRSRGVSLTWFLIVSAAEWMCYIVIAMLFAIPLSIVSTKIMLRTDSFLKLTSLDVALSWLPTQSFVGAALIAAVIVILGIRPVVSTFQRTLSNNARSRRIDRVRMFARIMVEVIVLIAVMYGYYQLYTQYDPASDVFSNLNTLILPVLSTIAIGMAVNRIIPLVLVLSERIARRSDALATILALQTLARRPERLQNTVLLLTITLGVGGYVASMAATIDTASQNGLSYRIGTDTQLIESALRQRPNANASDGDRFLLTPLGAHAQLPGIIAYAPVGQYDGRISIGNTPIDTNVVAVDRSRFAAVIPHFQDAWLGPGNSMGLLMNQLATYRDGVIIDKSIAGTSNIGDKVAVTLIVDDIPPVDVRMRIVGLVDGWPGQYSVDRPYLIMNLSYVSDEIGFLPPTDVWIHRDTRVPLDDVISAARAAAIPILDTVDFEDARTNEFTRPERQALFGMLSVGFVAAAGLTIMAILVSALASMRQRNIELGMLQAMGMPAHTARRVIVLEQSIITSSGMICGLLAALVCAERILPSLHAGVAPHRDIPTNIPITAWSTIAGMLAIYAVAVLVALGTVFRNSRSLRIADAVKLGDEN